ncbi:MAG TPA: HXXEE domain-containing protein [Thermoanaerobaculia bacterium]|nr:HXXEE domain-containing protein [Thermoanaerobaculia bacterium]
MTRASRSTFLTLVIAQAAHSAEEYSTRLYDVLPPARLVSGLLSNDHRIGFLIFNVSLVTFGMWCYFGPLSRGTRSALALAWFWVVLEVLNGFVHIVWAASAGAYRPGLATAPLLVVLALFLAWQLRRSASASRAAV